ncbi:MAG TPA: AAA family ATPase [Chitinophagales bacterium]|nr:AAA family ATPase [Chitinophagales bacterium]
MQLRKATRKKAKIRLGISGPSGSGKTISSLLMAFGLTGSWDKIAVIDSENNSADLYANHIVISDGKKFTVGEFQTLPLNPPYSPERYIEAIKACEDAGMEVIIIDSISHEWGGTGGILEIVDSLKNASNSKNAFTNGWDKASPRHNDFIEAMLGSKCHIIGCMRSKVEYVMESVERNGKTIQVPKKMGMAPIQREGVDYEFTIHLDLNLNHYATAMKDRSGLFTESFVPSVRTGQTILDWCESGQDTEAETIGAVEKLKNCDTVEELTDFKSTLPAYVISDARFIAAGKQRYNEIVKPKTEGANV